MKYGRRLQSFTDPRKANRFFGWLKSHNNNQKGAFGGVRREVRKARRRAEREATK